MPHFVADPAHCFHRDLKVFVSSDCWIFKCCCFVDLLTVPYVKLINESFVEGIFPDALKISVIKHIYKKRDKCDLNNYCPIALLSTSATIFESVMSKKVPILILWKIYYIFIYVYLMIVNRVSVKTTQPT